MSQLPVDLLARCQQLPLKPAPALLTGRFVRLEPLDAARHAAALYAVSNGSAIDLAGRTYPAYDADALIWRYLFQAPFTDIATFERYVADPGAGFDWALLRQRLQWGDERFAGAVLTLGLFPPAPAN